MGIKEYLKTDVRSFRNQLDSWPGEYRMRQFYINLPVLLGKGVIRY